MKMPPPCRLFVIQAREQPVALILRRGPSRWWHLIRWRTDDDTFEHGAWFHGRIYEDRCDLSPDGELLLYFALQGSRWQTDYKGTWTAVSRVPWLHALVLWPQGDTWGGGGRFVGKREVVIAGQHAVTHPSHPLVGLKVRAPAGPLWPTRGFLGSVAMGRPKEADEIEGAYWTGRDLAGNLIYTRDGGVFRRRDGEDVPLADFNGLTPDPQPAPDWARKPLSRLK